MSHMFVLRRVQNLFAPLSLLASCTVFHSVSSCNEACSRRFSVKEQQSAGNNAITGMSWVLEHNKGITEHVHLCIRLLPRIIHHNKEDPLIGVFTPALDSLVPEADGWMSAVHAWAVKKGKTNLSTFTMQLLDTSKALIDDDLWFIRIWMTAL